MKRELIVTASAMAMLVAGISGCSSNKSSTGSSGASSASTTSAAANTTPTAPATTSASAGGTSWNITLNGKALAQNVNYRDVTCGRGTPISGPSRGKTTVEITAGPANAEVSEGPLQVQWVNITDDTRATYRYDPSQASYHVGGGDAQVTQSGNTYKITGHIAPYENAQGQTQKDATPVPFELDATCP